MSYRDIPEDRVLKFPATPGFKGWKDHFTADSITHPAKMNLNLLRWILKTYTKPGKIVLDPMAGTGSTIILASLLGRHGVAVEYEPQFCKMIDENINRTRVQSSLMSKGAMICIQGDARELSKLLEESDAIITSPPYGEAQSGGGIAVKGYEGPKHSPTDLIGKRSYMPDKFEKDDNIGVLKYGDVDAVVTSPPYGNRLSDDVVQDDDPQRMSYRQAVDSIVTSPPYEESLTGGGQVDKEGFTQGHTQGKHCFKDGYSIDEDNIGNLKSESYLEAMLQCYREFFKVLKPQGVMILVTKNFIRDKQVVRLDLDTIKLCEDVGFRFSDRWYLKLTTMSFWKILYRRKYPDAPQINYEDVLVFTKGVDILDKSRGPPRV